MTPKELIDAFEVLADAPDGIARLRELVLALAVRGTLVSQTPADGSADDLTSTFGANRDELIESGTIAVPRHPEGEPVGKPPYEIPSSWVWMRLGDVGAIVGGGTPKSKDPRCWADEGVPWLTPADMRRQESRYVSRGSRDISNVGLETSSARLVPPRTVLFSSRAPIGHVGIAAQELATNQGFKSCVPYCSAMSEYIYLYLRKIGPEIDAAATGTTFKEVSGKGVSLIPIPVPPLPEQERIAAKVDELMALLDRLEAAQGSREATRQALRDAALSALREADGNEALRSAWTRIAAQMDHLFLDPADVSPLRESILEMAVRGKLVAQDRGDEPASKLLERFSTQKTRLVDEKKIKKGKPLPPVGAKDVPFELPAGWEIVRLDHLLRDMSSGWSPKCPPHPTTSEADWGVLKTTAIQRNEFQEWHHKVLPPNLEPRPHHEVQEGDVLVTRAGPWFRVGVAACVPKCRPRLMLSDKIIRCEMVIPEVSGRWLAMAINTGPTASYLRAKQTGMDQAQVNISQSRLRSAPILVPPLAEQERIVAKVGELLGICVVLEDRLQRTREARASFATSAVASIQ